MKVLFDEDILKHLNHSLTLKTERGLRNSIHILIDKINQSNQYSELNIQHIQTYQRSELEFLRNIIEQSQKSRCERA